MHHLISHFILDKYALDEFSGSLPAAAIFVDVSGFSSLTEALARQGDRGAEALVEVMQGLFAPLVEAVYAQKGFVVGYAGDSFTAIFTLQEGLHLPVERALAAAVQLQAHVRDHPVIPTEYGGFPISIKAGVGFGAVNWLIVRDTATSRATYCVRGDCVDEAVAAESLAKQGEIVLQRSASEQLQKLVRTECLDGACLVVEVLGSLPEPLPVETPGLRSELQFDFYPRSLVEQELRGEFRPVVNLFISIPVDPDDEAFITPFMEGVFALQRRYGGFFLRPDMGDKGFNILMFWGAPAVHENDIDRALNFVLDLREFTRINFKAGITYKPAYAGFIGAGLREDYTAYGWGVNLASRMMQAAGPGEFWIDEEIRKRASRRFQLEPLGGMSFKGFKSPISTFRLTGRKPRTELAYHGEMVGREPETARLSQFLEPAGRGEFAGVLLVRGEAGIGKSRLVHSLQASEIGPAGTEWVVCEADDVIEEPFGPFRSWLKKRLAITDEMDDETRRQVFMSGLEGLLEGLEDPHLSAELVRTASVLGALVNVEQAGSLYEQLDAKGRYENTLIALGAVIRTLGARGPLVLLVEDLQWLDEESLTFLAYFIRTTRIAPDGRRGAAVLLTARSDVGLPVGEGFERLEIIDLPPLSAASLRPMASSLLDGEPSPELVGLLEKRSEGNPFFAEQILGYLVENDLLVRNLDGAIAPGAASLGSIPSDIRAVLIARLDRLSASVRAVVQTASVLGREFEVGLLAAMLPDETDLTGKIVAAEDADIWLALDEAAYMFRHTLVREAAYGMQLHTRQRKLHARALRAVESVFAEDLSPHYGELAHHAEQAGLAPQAYEYLVKAAQTAADGYQNVQAIEYLSRALSFMPPDEPRIEFDLLEMRVELFARTGDRLSQLKDLDRMEALAVGLQDDGIYARVWSRRASYFLMLADYPKAIEFAQMAVSRLEGEMGGSASLTAYNTWSISLMYMTRYRDAMEVAGKGLEHARRLNNRYYEGLSLNSMGMIAHEEDDAAAAAGYLSQAREVAEAIHDDALMARVLVNLGNVEGFLRKDFTAARRYYEEGNSILVRRGERNSQSPALLNLGWVTGLLGDFEAARSFHSQAVAISREVGNQHAEAYALINLSAAAGVQGDVEAAIAAARQALEITHKAGERVGESWAFLNMGHAHLAAGDLEQAEEAYTRCIALRLELGQTGFEMEPLAGLVQSALRRGDVEGALESTEHILVHLDRGGSFEGAEEPLRIYHACYEALVEAKDPRATSLLMRAGWLLDSFLSNLPDEAARSLFLSSAPWRGAIQQARLKG